MKGGPEVPAHPLGLAGGIPPHAVEGEAGDVAVKRLVLRGEAPQGQASRLVGLQEQDVVAGPGRVIFW